GGNLSRLLRARGKRASARRSARGVVEDDSKPGPQRSPGTYRPRDSMTALLDTNVLIRHFTADPPAQARRATAYLKAAPAGELTLLDLHVAECVYVLEVPTVSGGPMSAGSWGRCWAFRQSCSRTSRRSCGRSTSTSMAVSTSQTPISSPEPKGRASGPSWV